jgi:hypothetical protein
MDPTHEIRGHVTRRAFAPSNFRQFDETQDISQVVEQGKVELLIEGPYGANFS